jgi:hypothetical protein
LMEVTVESLTVAFRGTRWLKKTNYYFCVFLKVIF